LIEAKTDQPLVDIRTTAPGETGGPQRRDDGNVGDAHEHEAAGIEIHTTCRLPARRERAGWAQ
jgi:hypothetical protein